MAAYTSYIETKRAHVYLLHLPTNEAEVSKVFAAVREEYKNEYSTYDNFVAVESDGEFLRFIVELDTFTTGDSTPNDY